VVESPRLSGRIRWRLLWGKVRRFCLALFRPGYVCRSRKRRRGECQRCGACCQLGYRCQFLRSAGDITECCFHRLRPSNCRLFPIDERDLADRDLVAPDRPCGYRFEAADGEKHRDTD